MSIRRPLDRVRDARDKGEQLVRDLSSQNLLRAVVEKATGWKIAFGSGVATFAAGSASNTVTVPHGLQRVPVVVLGAGGRVTARSVFTVGALTNASFQVVLYDAANLARTGDETFYWLAIG